MSCAGWGVATLKNAPLYVGRWKGSNGIRGRHAVQAACIPTGCFQRYSFESDKITVRGQKSMSRTIKIKFEPLSVEETARQLGIPQERAQRILTLVGAKEQNPTRLNTVKKRANTSRPRRTKR